MAPGFSFASRTLAPRAADGPRLREWVSGLAATGLVVSNLLILDTWRTLGSGVEGWEAMLVSRQSLASRVAFGLLLGLACISAARVLVRLGRLRLAHSGARVGSSAAGRPEPPVFKVDREDRSERRARDVAGDERSESEAS